MFQNWNINLLEGGAEALVAAASLVAPACWRMGYVLTWLAVGLH